MSRFCEQLLFAVFVCALYYFLSRFFFVLPAGTRGFPAVATERGKGDSRLSLDPLLFVNLLSELIALFCLLRKANQKFSFSFVFPELEGIFFRSAKWFAANINPGPFSGASQNQEPEESSGAEEFVFFFRDCRRPLIVEESGSKTWMEKYFRLQDKWKYDYQDARMSEKSPPKAKQNRRLGTPEEQINVKKKEKSQQLTNLVPPNFHHRREECLRQACLHIEL